MGTRNKGLLYIVLFLEILIFRFKLSYSTDIGCFVHLQFVQYTLTTSGNVISFPLHAFCAFNLSNTSFTLIYAAVSLLYP